MQRRFEANEKLGSGTYGDVYKCVDVHDGSIYVLKKFKPTTQTTQLIREISIMQRLSKAHPNIVKLVAVEFSDIASPEIVMEKLPLNLLQFLGCFRDLGYVPMYYVKVLVRDMLRAVAFLHSRTVAHRDLKPENVLVDLLNRQTGEPIVHADMSPEEVQKVMCKVHHDLFAAHKSVNRLKRKVNHMRKLMTDKAAKKEMDKATAVHQVNNLLNKEHTDEGNNNDGSTNPPTATAVYFDHEQARIPPAARRGTVVTIITTEDSSMKDKKVSGVGSDGAGDPEGHSSPVNVLKRPKHQRPSDRSRSLDVKSDSSTPACEVEPSTASPTGQPYGVDTSGAKDPSSPTAISNIRRTSSTLSVPMQTANLPLITSPDASPNALGNFHQRDQSFGALDSQEASMSFNSFSATPTPTTGLLSRESMSNCPSVPTTSLLMPHSPSGPLGSSAHASIHNSAEIATALAAQQAAAEAAAQAKERLKEFEKLQYAVSETEHLQGQLAQLGHQYSQLSEMARMVQGGRIIPNLQNIIAQSHPPQQEALHASDPHSLLHYQFSQINAYMGAVRQQVQVSEEKLRKANETIQKVMESPASWAADPTLEQYTEMAQELENQLKKAEEELEKRLANLPVHPVARLCDFGMCRMMLPSDQTAAATTTFYAGEEIETEEEGAPSTLSPLHCPSGPLPPALPVSNNNGAEYGGNHPPPPLPLPLPRASTCAPIPSAIHHEPVYPPRQPTPRVMTVSYRAAEVLMDKPMYGHAIDIWSIGCMIPELITLTILIEYVPIHRNPVVDYGDGLWPNIINLFRVLGVPKTQEEWAAISDSSMTATLAAEFPKFRSKLREAGNGKVAASLGEEGLDLLTRMLAFVPEERITAQQALDHPFLADVSRMDFSVRHFFQS